VSIQPPLHVGEITAVSLPGLLTELGTLTTAIDAVTLGTLHKTSWGEETIISNAAAASKQAQAESSMLVQARGETTEAPCSFRIPTIDFSAFNYAPPPNGDVVIIAGAGASTATTNLVAALEATVKTPWDETEGIVVVGMLAER
jgi:hypothetical protein